MTDSFGSKVGYSFSLSTKTSKKVNYSPLRNLRSSGIIKKTTFPQRRKGGPAVASKYQQLAEILRRDHVDGHCGEKLPTEQELSARYQVSRQTVRHALQLLADEHITAIAPVGEPFDAGRCEAILAVDPKEGEESGIVKEVYAKGYEQNGKVLRFAQVLVTK